MKVIVTTEINSRNQISIPNLSIFVKDVDVGIAVLKYSTNLRLTALFFNDSFVIQYIRTKISSGNEYRVS
jgi:hypothetical protein